tara:strand:- start:6905 stop:7294 length:390 start_codon:yes stop_codon:yes gene_type:complete
MSSDLGNPRFPVGLRVLVVDDDPLCLRIVEKMLKRCQYEGATNPDATGDVIREESLAMWAGKRRVRVIRNARVRVVTVGVSTDMFSESLTQLWDTHMLDPPQHAAPSRAHRSLFPLMILFQDTMPVGGL